MWDHHLITGPLLKEVSLQVESEFDKDDKHASLQIEMEKNAQCSALVRFATRAPRRLGTLANHQQRDHAV